MLAECITQILSFGDLDYNFLENWKLIVATAVLVTTLHQIVSFLQAITSKGVVYFDDAPNAG